MGMANKKVDAIREPYLGSSTLRKMKSITGFARNVMGIRSDPPTIKIVPNFAKVGSFTDNRPPLR